MSTPAEGPQQQPRPSAEARATSILDPIVRKVANLIRRLDVREGRQTLKKAMREGRRDITSASQPNKDLAELAARYGVSPEGIKAAATQAAEAYVRQQSGQAAGQQGGPDAQFKEGEHAQNVGMNPPVSEGQGHAPGSASSGGSAVSNIERGKTGMDGR